METFRKENILDENMLNGINGSLTWLDKKISELEDIAIETIQNETKKIIKRKENEQKITNKQSIGEL